MDAYKDIVATSRLRGRVSDYHPEPEWLADIRKHERETFVTFSISELREVLDMRTFMRLIEIRRGKATDFQAVAGQELTHGSIIDVPVEFPPELTEQQIAELSTY